MWILLRWRKSLSCIFLLVMPFEFHCRMLIDLLFLEFMLGWLVCGPGAWGLGTGGLVGGAVCCGRLGRVVGGDS